MISTGFSLIGLPIKYETKLPFNLSVNLKIDKPNASQLKIIKRYLGELSDFQPYDRPFEHQNIRKRGKDIAEMHTYTIDSVPREKEDWLYSVVKFKSEPNTLESPSKELHDLGLAALIGEKDFPILHNFYSRLKFGWGNNLEAIAHLENIFLDDDVYLWTKSDLLQLKKNYNDVQKVKDNFVDIYHSLNLYSSLPKLAGYNELICLGLFSTIESVLTHNPKSGTDSIGHQIRSKIKLLSNRFDKAIDYSKFESIPVDTLWKKLYDFRSRIAHGGKINFDKEFKILISSYDVQIFLNTFLRTLLRNALVEPQLYIDLKEC
jgi:hypothetical protein